MTPCARTTRLPGRARTRGDSGETLVELLVTITIMGVLFIAVVGGVATTIAMSDVHRQEGTAEGAIRSFAERVSDPSDVAYVDCATKASYASPVGFTLPAGWTASVVSVGYWQGNNPPTFTGACPSPDKGLQQLTLQVQSKAGAHQATETIVIVKRRP